ncbi:Transcription factor IIIA [Ranunculus cassubicifolius]
MRIHTRTHRQENNHICPYEGCGKRYVFYSTLQSHILARHEWYNKINDNVRDNQVRKFPIVCPHENCGRMSNDEGALKRHYRIHVERRHVCHFDGCGKKFRDSYKLKRHTLTHTGEKTYVCPHEGCGKVFSLEHNMRTHVKIHKQENYHICPYEGCGKRYAFDHKLHSHILARHERYNKSIGNSERKNHKRKFPFVCPYKNCGKTYVYEYKFTLHLRRYHPLHLVAPVYDDDDDDDDDEGTKEGRANIPPLKIKLRIRNDYHGDMMREVKQRGRGSYGYDQEDGAGDYENLDRSESSGESGQGREDE